MQWEEQLLTHELAGSKPGPKFSNLTYLLGFITTTTDCKLFHWLNGMQKKKGSKLKSESGDNLKTNHLHIPLLQTLILQQGDRQKTDTKLTNTGWAVGELSGRGSFMKREKDPCFLLNNLFAFKRSRDCCYINIKDKYMYFTGSK